MATLRTSADVRSFVANKWRTLLPDLLVPQARLGNCTEDDKLVQIDLLEGGPVTRLLFVPLASGEPRMLRGLLPRLRELSAEDDTWAGLAVPHMASAGVKVCREAGVGFIDCCGNAYLRFNQVVVQIAGNRNKFGAPKRPRTLFNDKATIPLRILLENPDALVTTREIAERGGMSIGWVSQILQQLHSQGYVERRRGGGTRVTDPPRLLSDWLGQYAFEHNAVFPFRMRDTGVGEALQRLRTLRPPLFDRYALTLDAAVAALHSRRPPKQLHVYLPDLTHDREKALDAWSSALDLRPAGHGADCFLVAAAYRHATFFGMNRVEGLRLVSDLQLYLDLFHYPAASRPEAQASIAARLPFALPGP